MAHCPAGYEQGDQYGQCRLEKDHEGKHVTNIFLLGDYRDVRWSDGDKPIDLELRYSNKRRSMEYDPRALGPF